ncbi:MAG TPA: pyridoxal-phosphate dependent enzyme [Cyclobacteriaceae bacterium]|nr:pyridoxal-phosphate dependent enzyme [Cyclobacteriaceae bacterium]HMV07692.1 pyridoxal-phosphate dependent enzyme [Cyclobacteriaceae bacterium]HMV88493.1 pyridoxal-phosphate dependent enzyme [Cyclobacteriaceae bacterium]HMW98827.1 pyridoxal-phosphate dependent enzyme [Cyclobacteriaceae bacterium]HMX48540.1 pyridoxal-phosphate dependent enzyme [Cyclobacteriaceae bacterium]
MITKQDIEQAHERIKPYVHRTPVLTSQSINDIAGCSIYFKCENLQNVGAFKVRGAMNAALQLPADKRSKGIATHSSGNHAQAIARAGKILGTPAYIVMPNNAPLIKKEGVKGYGGQIFECEPNLKARETTLAEVIAKTDATEIHPFNNYHVMTGQATAAKELIEDVNDLDFLMAPVGGGGLLSGTLMAAKYFSPKTKVIAGEPAGADDAYRSMQSGKIEQSQSNTIADGLLTTLGDKTFPIIHENVTRVITVTDAEIVQAMRLIWERMKMIIEPSCAVPFAALLKEKSSFAGKKVGIILSGGNVDLEKALKLFSK